MTQTSRRHPRLAAWATAFLIFFHASPGASGELLPAPEGTDVQEIVRISEATMRGDTSYCECQMTVRSPRLAAPRVVAFQS